MKIQLMIGLAAVAIGITGCSNELVMVPRPQAPPAYIEYGPREAVGRYTGQLPPLIQSALCNGGRAGFEAGARDSYYRAGYAPRSDESYLDAPGYDFRLGPAHPYVDAYRDAYLRAYDRGFYRR